MRDRQRELGRVGAREADEHEPHLVVDREAARRDERSESEAVRRELVSGHAIVDRALRPPRPRAARDSARQRDRHRPEEASDERRRRDRDEEGGAHALEPLAPSGPATRGREQQDVAEPEADGRGGRQPQPGPGVVEDVPPAAGEPGELPGSRPLDLERGTGLLLCDGKIGHRGWTSADAPPRGFARGKLPFSCGRVRAAERDGPRCRRAGGIAPPSVGPGPLPVHGPSSTAVRGAL